MQKVIETTTKVNPAWFATIYDVHGVLTKVDGQIYFLHDDGEIEEFTVEMAPWCTLHGEVGLCETQKLMDQVRGGYAAICTSRAMGVA